MYASMLVYMDACMRVCMDVQYECEYVCIYVCMYASMYGCTVCLKVPIYVLQYVLMFLYLYVCVCMYVCIDMVNTCATLEITKKPWNVAGYFKLAATGGLLGGLKETMAMMSGDLTLAWPTTDTATCTAYFPGSRSSLLRSRVSSPDPSARASSLLPWKYSLPAPPAALAPTGFRAVTYSLQCMYINSKHKF